MDESGWWLKDCKLKLLLIYIWNLGITIYHTNDISNKIYNIFVGGKIDNIFNAILHTVN